LNRVKQSKDAKIPVNFALLSSPRCWDAVCVAARALIDHFVMALRL
jgi:hypothetical protein